MAIIKEPLDVDFVVDPRPLTVAEEKVISVFYACIFPWFGNNTWNDSDS